VPQAAVVLQVPLWQVSPVLQTLPAQHTWLAPPHTGAAVQMPFVQTRPEAQMLPAQHGRRSPPQVVGGEHVPD
jgi:hypothetical protein